MLRFGLTDAELAELGIDPDLLDQIEHLHPTLWDAWLEELPDERHDAGQRVHTFSLLDLDQSQDVFGNIGQPCADCGHRRRRFVPCDLGFDEYFDLCVTESCPASVKHVVAEAADPDQF